MKRHCHLRRGATAVTVTVVLGAFVLAAPTRAQTAAPHGAGGSERAAAGILTFFGESAESDKVPAGEVVVGFSPGTGRAARHRALETFGLSVVRVIPGIDFARVRSRRPVPLGRLRAHPAIASAEPVSRARAAAVPPPNDANFPRQWNLPMIQVPDAWAVTRGAGAVVAVLDTGVAYRARDSHPAAPDLVDPARPGKFVPGKDFVDGDDFPDDEIDPAARANPTHGTHVAGIIAHTTDNGRSEAGVAPGASIMPVRVLRPDGTGDADAIAAGLVWAADRGAHVANMSFTLGADVPVLREAVAYAAARGVTMVAPAGNTGTSPVAYPARYPAVLSVGAVKRDRTRAAYSSTGTDTGDVDLVAPGGVTAEDLDGDGFGDGILAQTMYGFDSEPARTEFADFVFDGTSSAVPHVSAVAALLVASGLATTPAQVRSALLSSALDLGSPGPDLAYGAGLVQASAALAAAAAAAADLSVTVADEPDPVVRGGTLAYTATVRNAGPAPATGVTAAFTLPVGFGVTGTAPGQGSCTVADREVACALGSLAASTSATVRVTGTVGSAGPLAAVVTVTGNEGDATRSDNTASATTTVQASGSSPSAAATLPGYRLVASDGGIFAFGDAPFLGSTGALRLNRPVVGMAPTPSGLGYWIVASDGGIFAFGDARFLGSTGATRLNQPIVGMAPTPSGLGYWLVASDGGIFAFGDAPFLGSTGATRLNQPIVGMAPTPSGLGYWLVASDGGIFAFGDARFLGSTGATRLNQPIVGMAATPSGNGYRLVASDGGIFAFGDGRFFGSTGALRLNQPIVGMAPTPSGLGYWLVASDGGIFAFGDAPFLGSTGALRLNQPVVGMAARR